MAQIQLRKSWVEVRVRRRKRQRRMCLSVSRDGVLTVTASYSVTWIEMIHFLEESRSWVESILRHFGICLDELAMRRDRERTIYRTLREAVTQKICKRLQFFNQWYAVPISRVTIRNQRSRWGSASATGCFSFNYRWWYLPPSLQDYIVVHELCHLRELNHSSRFWALVAETIPDFQACREELRQIKFDTL